MISIVIPVKDGGADLVRCLEAIARQQIDEDVEVVVVDSGSRDGSAARARRLGARVREISPSDFHHGRTRNLGAELAEGDTLVFTSQDAYAATQTWLTGLTTPLRSDARVAGAYGRQLPHDDATPPERYFLDFLYGAAPRIQRLARAEDLSFESTLFSNVNSAMPKSVWEAFPFADDVVMSEDQEWSRLRPPCGPRHRLRAARSRVSLAHVFTGSGIQALLRLRSVRRALVCRRRPLHVGVVGRGRPLCPRRVRVAVGDPSTTVDPIHARLRSRKVHGPPAGPAAPRASDEPEVPVERLPRILEHVAAEWRTARPHPAGRFAGSSSRRPSSSSRWRHSPSSSPPRSINHCLSAIRFGRPRRRTQHGSFTRRASISSTPSCQSSVSLSRCRSKFPLFQAAAALVMDAGLDDDLAMRLTGLLCFLLERGVSSTDSCATSPTPRAGSRPWSRSSRTPFALLWGRASMIEYLATAGAVGFAWATIAWRENRRPAVAGLALAAGLVGMLVKPTTAVFSIIPALAYRPVGSRPADGRRGVALLTALVLVPIAAASLWTRHADAMKKAASPTTAWLTSSNLEDWNFGTLAQRLDPGVWGVSRVRAQIARQPCRRRACCLYGIRVTRP